MFALPGRIPLLLAVGLALSGCINPAVTASKSPLQPPQMPPDSVAMDIIFVRVPLGDAEINGKMWDEIDEQHFPAELRERLLTSGIRVGLIGNQVPRPLAKLLALTDKPPGRNDVQQVRAADMAADAEETNHPIRRHLQMQAGHRNEIIASSVYEQLPVLIAEGGELHGKTYCQAQGMLAVKAFPQSDGRVRVELVPELHHDQPRRRFAGDQGMMRLRRPGPGGRSTTWPFPPCSHRATCWS